MYEEPYLGYWNRGSLCLRRWRQETGRAKEVGEEEGFWEKSVINI